VGATHRHPDEAKDVAFNPCGQVIGRATSVRKTRDVIFDLVEEYVEAVERLSQTTRVEV
jgi:NAD(P)H-dependent flavin oxidoreductase YrpB (nitropropane dioxygenase family)